MDIEMNAIEVCREVLSRSGSTFTMAFRLLPEEQRDAMTAFYAFCRLVDDAVDSAGDRVEARAALGSWRERLANGEWRTANGERRPVDEMVAEALAESAMRFGIRREHLELVIDGVEMDLDRKRYETFADLYEYCYRVASAVGLVCVTVLGAGSREAFAYAELAGIAVQLTNILRDVGEDAGRDRIYLPMEDLRRFGVSEGDVAGRRCNDNTLKLLQFQARRAREYYSLAGAALPRSLAGRLFFAEAIRETYRVLLDRIESEGFPVFERRVTVPTARKAAIALRHRVGSWLS